MGRLFVEVRSGPQRGRRAMIAPGGALRVGRAEQADLTLPGDTHVSRLHCELSWDGAVCTLSDLDSIEGTRIDGVASPGSAVRDGDVVTVGTTLLSVHFEDGLPARRKDAPGAELRERRLSALTALRAEGPLYAVLDAARDPRILGLLMRAEEERTSLYEGAAAWTLEHVAPYLVRFAERSPLLERLVMEGWGSAWGIYLTWPGRAKELRAHLRRFLIVLDEESGDKLYFRFYDPRVLRDFLPTCAPMQIADLLGGIGALLVEDADARVKRFARDGAPW